MTPPTMENSKNPNVGKCASTNSPFTIRFVDVPIKVMAPPKIEANDKGIKNLEGGIFLLTVQR